MNAAPKPSLLHEEILTKYAINKSVAIRPDNTLPDVVRERKTTPMKECDEGYRPW